MCISLDSEINLLNSSFFESLDRIDISDLDTFIGTSSPNSSPPVLVRSTGKNIRLSTRDRQHLLSTLDRPASSGPSSIPAGACSLPQPSGKNLRLSAGDRQDLLSELTPDAPANRSPRNASYSPPSDTRNAPRLPLRPNHGRLRRRSSRTRRFARTRRTKRTCTRRQLASIALRAVSLFAELVQLIL
ncbi:uncharacterized protein LOC112432828 [Maylandia zebra]|uniref:uncharacterized protein LOC112432828 n=1 Tax=Maylandia zebra TaxID=106582 RepID=UPI00403C40C8